MLKTTESSKVLTPRMLEANVIQIVDDINDRLVESKNLKSIGYMKKSNSMTRKIASDSDFKFE